MFIKFVCFINLIQTGKYQFNWLKGISDLERAEYEILLKIIRKNLIRNLRSLKIVTWKRFNFKIIIRIIEIVIGRIIIESFDA